MSMCNACGFQCCAWDGFSGCGCDHCSCPECWDEDEDEDDDFDIDDYEDEVALFGMEGQVFDCGYAGCLMPSYHFRYECHNAKDIEAMYDEHEQSAART